MLAVDKVGRSACKKAMARRMHDGRQGFRHLKSPQSPPTKLQHKELQQEVAFADGHPLKKYLGWFWFYHSYPLSLPGPGHVTAASADAAFTGNIDGIFGYGGGIWMHTGTSIIAGLFSSSSAQAILGSFYEYDRSLVYPFSVKERFVLYSIDLYWYHEDGRLEMCNIIVEADPANAGFITGAPGTLGPMLGRIDAKFIRQIKYPDTIIIGIKNKDIRNDRFVMETLAVSVEQGVVVAKADSHVAIIDMATGKRADMPPEMLNAVTAFT
eukprot:gene6762-30751_t